MHSRSAYLHAVRALPSPENLHSGPIRQNSFEFTRADQIESQLIELGWAFFPRYEACLDKWLKDQGVKLSKQVQLKDWLTSRGVSIPAEFSEGLKLYRQIRNTLHHDDGASLSGNPETEIHLLPEYMENFFELFCWIGTEVETANRADEGESRQPAAPFALPSRGASEKPSPLSDRG
ncbi:hypothetical protein ACFPTV_03955 [Sinirhodobacter huangdaonensis]|nr:hypothetical protein [Sinirhodobacter huangdaonensis]